MLFNIFFCCITLLKYALVEDSMYHFFKTPYFWVSSGLLIFSLATLVVLGLQNYILSHRVQIQQINVYRIVMPIANIVLYSAYSYAFILCRPHQLKQPFL
jgi:ABC-type Co2+ transport system permease subunit